MPSDPLPVVNQRVELCFNGYNEYFCGRVKSVSPPYKFCVVLDDESVWNVDTRSHIYRLSEELPDTSENNCIPESPCFGPSFHRSATGPVRTPLLAPMESFNTNQDSSFEKTPGDSSGHDHSNKRFVRTGMPMEQNRTCDSRVSSSFGFVPIHENLLSSQFSRSTPRSLVKPVDTAGLHAEANHTRTEIGSSRKKIVQVGSQDESQGNLEQASKIVDSLSNDLPDAPLDRFPRRRTSIYTVRKNAGNSRMYSSSNANRVSSTRHVSRVLTRDNKDFIDAGTTDKVSRVRFTKIHRQMREQENKSSKRQKRCVPQSQDASDGSELMGDVDGCKRRKLNAGAVFRKNPAVGQKYERPKRCAASISNRKTVQPSCPTYTTSNKTDSVASLSANADLGRNTHLDDHEHEEGASYEHTDKEFNKTSPAPTQEVSTAIVLCEALENAKTVLDHIRSGLEQLVKDLNIVHEKVVLQEASLKEVLPIFHL